MSDIYNSFIGKGYRFLSFEGLWKTLETGTFRLTRVTALNDPLDNSPFLSPYPWQQLNSQADLMQLAIASLKPMSEHMYVGCFCKSYKAQKAYLMWAYYASNHTQVCFEIDFAKHSFLGGPSNVTYTSKLSSIRDNFIQKGSTNGFGLFLLTHKNSVWKHEQEVRLIVDKQRIVGDKRFKFSTDQEHMFVKLDLSFISKVIFGINSTDADELKTRILFKELGINPKFEKMKINPVTLTLQAGAI